MKSRHFIGPLLLGSILTLSAGSLMASAEFTGPESRDGLLAMLLHLPWLKIILAAVTGAFGLKNLLRLKKMLKTFSPSARVPYTGQPADDGCAWGIVAIIIYVFLLIVAFAFAIAFDAWWIFELLFFFLILFDS